MKSPYILLIALLTFACSSSRPSKVTKKDLANQDFGVECPENYTEVIKSYMELKLINSSKAKYAFSPCKKGKIYTGHRSQQRYSYGYVASARINDLNSNGLHTGYKNYKFFFKGGKIALWSEGKKWFK